MKKLKLLIIVILTVKYALAQNFPNQKITYYSNGNIKTQYTYQDSILNGPYIGYFTQRDPIRSVQTDPYFPTAFFNLITSVFCIVWRS